MFIEFVVNNIFTSKTAEQNINGEFYQTTKEKIILIVQKLMLEYTRGKNICQLIL